MGRLNSKPPALSESGFMIDVPAELVRGTPERSIEATVAGPRSEPESTVVTDIANDGTLRPGGGSTSSSESVRSLSDSKPDVGSIAPNPDLAGLGGRRARLASLLAAAAEARHHERMLNVVSE